MLADVQVLTTCTGVCVCARSRAWTDRPTDGLTGLQSAAIFDQVFRNNSTDLFFHLWGLSWMQRVARHRPMDQCGDIAKVNVGIPTSEWKFWVDLGYVEEKDRTSETEGKGWTYQQYALRFGWLPEWRPHWVQVSKIHVDQEWSHRSEPNLIQCVFFETIEGFRKERLEYSLHDLER